MAKTLNELSRLLKEFIADHQDAHTSRDVKKYRYNNLKIEVSDPRTAKTPQVFITIGISEAAFNIMTGEKISGSLGPDERYVIRWLDKVNTKEDLKALLKDSQKSVGKVSGRGK